MDPYVKSRSPSPLYQSDNEAAEYSDLETEEARTACLGSICEIQDLWQTFDKKGRTRYVDTEPELSKQEDKNKSKGNDVFAMTRYQIRQRNEWQTSSITIRSPFIKDMLRATITKHANLNQGNSTVDVTPPFAEFHYDWEKFSSYKPKDPSPEALKHIKLFRDLIRNELEPHVQALARFNKHGLISFNSIFTLFRPGDLVYFEEYSREGLMRLKYVEASKNGLDLVGYQTDWNGEYTGRIDKTLYIKKFSGETGIEQQDVIPLHLHKSAENIKQRLLQRGQRFSELRGYHFKRHGNERVIIDSHGWHNLHTAIPFMDRIIGEENDLEEEEEPAEVAEANSDDDRLFRSAAEDSWDTWNNRKKLDGWKSRVEDLSPMDEDALLTSVYNVRGFRLKTKCWDVFEVDEVEDIDWNDDAYSNLVLPAQEKRMLLGFVKQKISGTGAIFDDFISGKGRGMIVLLCGRPGVGKTLTVESIAETLRIPIYTLNTGDIGSDPSAVGEKLNVAMQRCALWNALLLLDEADVFLEQRGSDNLTRNELTSVFLREIEYYEGLMFLTTNRVKAIDSAFESRIDMILDYPDLDVPTRRQIWSNFLNRLPGAGQSDDDGDRDMGTGMGMRKGHVINQTTDLDELAQHDYNGRQIKNAVKMAYMAAAGEGLPVSMDHVRIVIKMRHRVGF